MARGERVHVQSEQCVWGRLGKSGWPKADAGTVHERAISHEIAALRAGDSHSRGAEKSHETRRIDRSQAVYYTSREKTFSRRGRLPRR